jgi:hypothetical protein
MGMDAAPHTSSAAFGFLTALDSIDHGLFGGYLAVSPWGRPLEFRCTTPVIATRAQQLLYGPTLRPYLMGEVIGPALLRGAELPVALLLTDCPEMLALSPSRGEQVLLVEPAGDCGNPAVSAVKPGWPSPGAGLAFDLGGCRIIASVDSPAEQPALRALLEPLVAHVYLAEPFDRIRAALNEAQQASRDAAELKHDRAHAA